MILIGRGRHANLRDVSILDLNQVALGPVSHGTVP